jgi:hypothetical protein
MQASECVNNPALRQKTVGTRQLTCLEMKCKYRARGHRVYMALVGFSAIVT